MRKLKDKNYDPRLGWFYQVPETKCLITSMDFETLVTDVMEHYEINEIKREKGEVAIEIEHFIAGMVPAEHMYEE